MRLRLALILPVAFITTLAVAQPERGEPLPRKAVLGARLTPAEGGGVTIAQVIPGQTIEAMGLLANDVILAIGESQVNAPADVVTAFRQVIGGESVTLQYRRGTETKSVTGSAIARPMQKPDGFRVHYDQVVSNGNRIRVIATYPETSGPHPTVFLIGGIGAYSVDGDFGGVAYGNVMAPIAKGKYATVRIDKPGMGDSEGPIYTELGFAAEQDAYLQALRLAKTLPFVDANRIAIFGHSMGGTFGPLVASEEPVAGMAVYGTLSKTWVEYVIENTRRQALLGGGSPADVDAMMRPFTAFAHYMFNDGLSPQEIIDQHPELEAIVRSNTPDLKTYSGVGIPFFQHLAKINLADAMVKSNTRVFSMFGENEFITGRWDHEFIAEIVNAARPGTAEFVVVPGSDHGFFRTTSPRSSLENWGRGGEFNPAVVDLFTAWLDKTIG
ncbi:MAG: alpha/beta fold hydrolase [Fimbriimonadaceae bacterium]|nr:alpha/beta fold hydrolase [Fimbriimonadaceae bacterium]